MILNGKFCMLRMMYTWYWMDENFVKDSVFIWNKKNPIHRFPEKDENSFSGSWCNILLLFSLKNFFLPNSIRYYFWIIRGL